MQSLSSTRATRGISDNYHYTVRETKSSYYEDPKFISDYLQLLQEAVPTEGASCS